MHSIYILKSSYKGSLMNISLISIIFILHIPITGIISSTQKVENFQTFVRTFERLIEHPSNNVLNVLLERVTHAQVHTVLINDIKSQGSTL